MGTGKTYSTKYLLDSNNNSGVAGQVLSTTSTGIDWVDANTVPGSGLWLENGNDIYNSNSGNVGIGLTNPDRKLHVKDSTIVVSEFEGSNTGSLMDLVNSNASQLYNGIRFTQGTTGKMAITHIADGTTKGYVQIGNSWATGSEILVVDGRTSNVGIGTTNPLAKVAILTSGTFVLNSNGNDYSGVNIQMKTTNTAVNAIGSGIVWNKGASSRKVAAITNYIYGDADQSGLNFYVQPTSSGSSAVLTEAMRITNTGNVGIGEDTPENILHIKTAAAGGPQIQLESTSGTAAAAFINFDSTSLQLSTQRDMVDGTWYDTAKSWGGINIQGPAGGSFITFQTAAASNTSPSERLRIASDGKIQVGSDKVIWAGGYGGALVIRQNNATSDRLIKMVTVDSTGAIAADNVLVAKGSSVGIGTDSPVSTWLSGFDPSTGNNTFKLTSEGWIVTPYLTGLAGYYPGQGARPIVWADDSGTNLQCWDNSATDGISLRSSNGTTRLFVKENGNVGIGTDSPTSLLEVSQNLSAASTIDYPYTISSRDDGNLINQQGGEGVGIKFRIAGNAGTTPGDSLVGASIAAIREDGSDTNSSTGLGFFVTQNDETLDEALRIDHDKNANFLSDVDITGSLDVTGGTIDVGSQTWKSYTNTAAKLNIEVAGGNAINIFNTQEDAAFLNFVDSQSDGAQYANLSFNSSSTNAFIINNMGYETTISSVGEWTFTQAVSGITPTADANFATKAYVDERDGTVKISGTPVAKQIAEWVSDDTIKGSATLQVNSSGTGVDIFGNDTSGATGILNMFRNNSIGDDAFQFILGASTQNYLYSDSNSDSAEFAIGVKNAANVTQLLLNLKRSAGVELPVVSEIGSDTDRFLMLDTSNDNLVKYVTGANLLSYIGGTSSSGVTSIATTAPILGGTITGTGTLSLKTPVSGNWFNGGATVVGTDGLMEVGRYIDFHNTDTATSDFDVRLDCRTGNVLRLTGTFNTTSDVIVNAGLGVGTDNPLHAIEVYGDASNIAITNTTETDSGLIFRDAQAVATQAAAIKFNSSDNKLKFFVNDEVAQRMVIDTNGYVGINNTSPNVPLDVEVSDTGSSFNDGAAQFSNITTATSGGATVINVRNNYGGGNGTLIKFFRTSTSTSIGFISFNGAGDAVVYSTTSDYRLKEDLKSFNGLEIIDQIKTYNYQWKKSKSRGYGTLAHELQEVFPDAVTGEKDAEEMQGVDYSTLVPVLIKSIQELKKELEELKKKKK